MSVDRLPGSAEPKSAALPTLPLPQCTDAARRFTAALFLAASPVSVALAQSTLPPLSVETTEKKKRPPTARKAAAQPAQATPAESVAGPAGLPPDSYNVQDASSPKMTGPLLDTPQTVTVVPGTIIQERGNTNLTEVLKNTPGISFSAGENGFGSGLSNFQIRGFDSTGNIFIDGVRDSGNYPRDTFNIDRVEVVKGAAADNGRGSAGGYVNIVTKTPTLENFVSGETSLSFDEYNSEVRKRATIDVNQRSGTTAVRLNGMIEDGGVAGRDIAEANAWGLAPSIAFGLGTRFRAIFSYEHLERNDLPDWGVPAALIPGMLNFNKTAAKASRDNFYGLNSDFDDVRADAVTARFEYDLAPGFTISNQTRWSHTDRSARYTIPTAFVAPDKATTQMQFYDRVNEAISNQTNLSGTIYAGSLKHVISTGVEVMRETSDALTFGTVTDPGGTKTSIFDPNPGRFGGPFAGPTGSNALEVDTIAAYFYDTIHLNKQWQLVGGLRVDHYSYSIDGLAGGPADDSYTTVGGKIGIVYKPVKEGSFYASYGRSGLPPGSYLSNPDISRAGDQAFPGIVIGADPVEIDNYEVGVKWDFFGGRLSATAAAFRTEKGNIAYKGDTGKGFPPIAYGTQIVEGIELGIAGNITERLKVFGGVTWLDSERRHGAAVDAAAKLAGGSDYGTVITTSGDELAFTPNFFANLWLTYAVTDRFTIGGGVRYVGDSWLGRPDDAGRIIPNGKFGKLPDYFVVNLMASYELTKNIDLRFNIDNVFDETYAVSSNWPGNRVFLGEPRTFRIGTAFKY